MMESIKTLFEKRNILLSLRHYDPDDLAVNWELSSIAKNRDLFESLYSTHPLDCVSDINSYYYYLLTRKIFRMGELVHNPDIRFREQKDADLLEKLSDDAEAVIRKTSDSAIIYINEHAEDIFSVEQPNSELKYVSVDLIIECQESINYSVFKYLCQNFSILIIRRFGELRETFLKYQDLFTVLFPSGHLDLKNPFGLQTELGVWRQEYGTKDSPFKSVIDRYVDELCLDVSELLSETQPGERGILRIESVVKAVSLFLQQINSRQENKFWGFVSKFGSWLLQYLSAQRHSPKFWIPAGDEELKNWKTISSCKSKLTDLTHQTVSDAAGTSFVSFLEKSPCGQTADSANDWLSEKQEVYLSRLGEVNAENFLIILNSTETSDNYKDKVKSEIKFISGHEYLSDNSLEVDVSMLFCSLSTMVLSDCDDEHREVICYGASMFICGLTEKLLRLLYLYTVKNEPSKYKGIRTEKLTLSDLLRESAPLTSLFSTNHKHGLAYFLITISKGGAGRNYRNNLAHWEANMSPRLMDPIFASLLLWLFTDVLNSVYLYFKSIDVSQADSASGH